MNLLVVGAAAIALVVVIAVIGPFLIRAGAPVFMRFPRTAVAGLLSLPLLWWAVVAALSLMAASLLKGPDVLPVPLADVCQRCLRAASPFGGALFDTLVPVIIFLLLPLALSLGCAIRGVTAGRRRHRANAATALALSRRSTAAEVLGQSVRTMAHDRPVAFSLPHKYGGVVVSEELCARLDEAELTAVIAHERAHIRQRHHAIMALVEAFVRPLGFIPLFAEVATSVPLYLEIAADDCARRAAGTPALAGALLKIGTGTGAHGHLGGTFALNIAGPDRVRQLVAPVKVGTGVLPVVALTSVLGSFAVVFASVAASYATVVVTGCALP